MVNHTAIKKGENARSCLVEALSLLDSASSWGIFDILGGGMLTTLIKHSRIDKAKDLIYQSRQYLWEFGDELRNVPNINMDIGIFLTFADFCWDGLLSDILVQSRINEAKRQVRDAIAQIDIVLSRLRLV